MAMGGGQGTGKEQGAEGAEPLDAEEEEEELRAAAVELVYELVMAGDEAVRVLRGSRRLAVALKGVADKGCWVGYDEKGILRRRGPPLTQTQKLANKSLAVMGARKWMPKTKGQKGVRILCFDGGGTRGVLTLALLKHLEKALGGHQPHEVFDLIVGTSTGGIITGLCGIQAYPVSECSSMYDSLIKDIFIKRPGGGMKLALKQAMAGGWENGGEGGWRNDFCDSARETGPF
ncbi:unnamed protein product [Discosporangium mesarthrocarpum]